MNSGQRSFVAGVDIGPSLFVKISGVHKVAPASAGDPAYGVSHEGTREAPIPGVTPLHAAADESVTVYGPGDSCEVLCGAAVTAGEFVKPDGNAKAITALTGNQYSAQAINTTTAANQLLKITLVRGTMP